MNGKRGVTVAADQSTVIAYRLETTIEQEGEKEVFLYEGQGQMVQLGEWLYLRYEEQETEHRVTIKIARSGKVTILRRMGEELLSRMTFDTQQAGSALLPTPAGRMELQTVTTRLMQNYQARPFSGMIQMEYTLHSSDQLLGNYGMTLQFTT